MSTRSALWNVALLGALSPGCSASGASTGEGGDASAGSGGPAAASASGASSVGGAGGVFMSGGFTNAGAASAGGISAAAGSPGSMQPAGGTIGSGGTGTAGGFTTNTGGTTGAAGSASTSPGCGSANTTSTCGTKGTTCSLDVGGTARTYYVQLPKNYSPSVPYRLIFQFHPWGGSADQALTMYGLNSASGIPDAIYVTPQGLDAGDNGPGWANTNGTDIAFTKAMLADVQGKYCIDDSRIFSVGFSYGGMMSFAVACEMSDVFRAIAPMSGALYSDPSCKGTGHPIAMWGSHGTNDTVVPIDNGRAARDKVLLQNHCSAQTMPVDPSPCVTYQGCDAGYPVTWCEWDGPHGIPSFGSKSIVAFLQQF
jgi:predicted esterase